MLAELVPDRIDEKWLAKEAGLSPQTLCRYRDLGCTATTVEGVLDWRQENIGTNGPPTLGERRGGRAAAKSLDREEQEVRIRKLTAEAKAKELKNAEQEGRLVDREECISELACILSVFRARLEDLPDQVMTELPGELRVGIGATVKQHVYLALKELAATKIDVMSATAQDAVLLMAEQIKGTRRAHDDGRQIHNAAASEVAIDGNGCDGGGRTHGADCDAGVGTPWSGFHAAAPEGFRID